MIIQATISVSLILIFLFYMANSRRRALSVVAAVTGTVAGLVLTWQPDLATVLAQSVGLGRGADLIFYCWVLISMALFLNIHFRQTEIRQHLTNLVREIAIAEARAKQTDRGDAA